MEESFPSLCALCLSHLWSCCYYIIVSPLICTNSESSPVANTQNMLHNMIWHTRIISLSPWASNQTSANPTEARGTCEGKGFSLSSLLTATGRKSQIWAWDTKLRRVFGALERLSQCIQALAGTVVLRGCCAEVWSAPFSLLLFQLSTPRYCSMFILEQSVMHNLHLVPMQEVI